MPEHGCERSYNEVVRLTLAGGRRRKQACPGRFGKTHRREAPPSRAPRHDGAPGRLATMSGSPGAAGARPSSPWTTPRCEIYSAFLSTKSGIDVELPGAFRGDPSVGCSARSMPTGPVTTAQARSPEASARCDRVRPAPSPAPRHELIRGLFARSQGAVRAHVRHLAEGRYSQDRHRRHHRDRRGHRLPSRRSICPNIRPSPAGSPPRPRPNLRPSA